MPKTRSTFRARSIAWKRFAPSCCTACLGRKTMTRAIIVLVSLLGLATAVHAEQRHRDPLNDLEVDKLRDAAQDPEVRLKLYVEFARARLDKLQQVHADQKSAAD